MFDENAVWEMVTKEAESIIQREYGGKWTARSQRRKQDVPENDACQPRCSVGEDIPGSSNSMLAEQNGDAFLWDDLLTLGNADYRDLISALYDNLPENSPDVNETVEVMSPRSKETLMMDHKTATMSENITKPRTDLDPEEEFSVDAHFLQSQIIPNSHSAGDVFDFIVRNSSTSSVQTQSSSDKAPEQLMSEWDKRFSTEWQEQQLKQHCNEEHNVEFTTINADVVPESSRQDVRLLTSTETVEFDELLDCRSPKIKVADDPNLFNCSMCDYTTRSRTQFWRHRKALNHFTKKSTVGVPLLCCALCNYTTQSRFNITRHVERIHVAERRTSCKYCNALFKDADTLRKHCAYCNHAPAEDISTNACSSCARRFKTSSDLRRHIRLVHEGARAYACGHCFKHFQTGSNMRRHVAADVCGAAQYAAN